MKRAQAFPFASWRARLKRIAPLATIVRLARAWSTPLGRGRLRAARRGARLFQPATLTRMDRHPGLFTVLKAQLAACDRPHILSFGCSTGQEAFTLADYLPDATIDAIDANPACIASARRSIATRHTDRIRFACADAPDAFAPTSYDAVLCLSVLRHGDLDASQPERCTALLPFARFSAAVAALDRCLSPGGILVLWGCNFRFTDTATVARYQVMPTPAMRAQPGPFYGPDDRRLPDTAYAFFMFRKLA